MLGLGGVTRNMCIHFIDILAAAEPNNMVGIVHARNIFEGSLIRIPRAKVTESRPPSGNTQHKTHKIANAWARGIMGEGVWLAKASKQAWQAEFLFKAVGGSPRVIPGPHDLDNFMRFP